MKKIYFVRHGETMGNVHNYWQGPEEPLSERGLEQAKILAGRIKDLELECMFVSTMKRAKQTAAFISNTTGLTPVEHQVFCENKAPSSLFSADADSSDHRLIERYKQERAEHLEDSDWHFEDEENIADFMGRVKEAVAFLGAREESNILVVSHGNFIRSLTAHIVTGGRYSWQEAFDFRQKLKTVNTGITVFHVEDASWSLLTWNDHAHFADN